MYLKKKKRLKNNIENAISSKPPGLNNCFKTFGFPAETSEIFGPDLSKVIYLCNKARGTLEIETYCGSLHFYGKDSLDLLENKMCTFVTGLVIFSGSNLINSFMGIISTLIKCETHMS